MIKEIVEYLRFLAPLAVVLAVAWALAVGFFLLLVFTAMWIMRAMGGFW